MNIVIEDNIDFYKELYESDDEDSNELCLISQLPLNENHVVLSCGHKFNLIPIYNEVTKQKTLKNKTLDKNICSLKKNNFICPYCRKVQHQLLPHIKTDNINYIIGVNSPATLCMPYHKCIYKMKSGKNKGVLCDSAAFSYDGKCYCNKHYKIISYSQLNTFLISFNLDFIYYKLVDKNKVYFNSKDIVEKILHNLDMKREKEELYEDFIDSLANKKPIDFIKYDEQISQIINYLGGKPKYSRTFIESVKGVLGARSYEQLLSALKSLKVFPEDFEPLYSLLKLKKDFPYSDTEVENLTLNNSNSKDCFKAFTIDDEGTYDFDDAISIKKDDDFYSLSIYVTNFSSIFSDDSIFTKSAKDIINTIYAPSGNFNLYSKKMVNDISLVLGHERPVLSIIFKLKNFEIVSYKIEENTIQVSNNYTYMEFESLIEKNPDYNFLNEFLYEQRS